MIASAWCFVAFGSPRAGFWGRPAWGCFEVSECGRSRTGMGRAGVSTTYTTNASPCLSFPTNLLHTPRLSPHPPSNPDPKAATAPRVCQEPTLVGREQRATFLFSPRNASLRLLEVQPHKRTFNPIGWALGSDTRTGTGGTGTGSWQRSRCQKMSTGGHGDLLPPTEPPHPPALPHCPAAPLQLEASLALLRVFMAFPPHLKYGPSPCTGRRRKCQQTR